MSSVAVEEDVSQDLSSDRIEPLADQATGGGTARPGWLRDVALFLTAQSTSIIGSSLVTYALTWYITLKTGSGAQFALLLIASQLAAALTAIPGGVWADRHWRKLLMMASDAGVAIVTMILAAFMLNGFESVWLIAVCLALRGLGSGIQQPAVSAALPQIAPSDKLLRINSLNQALQAIIMVASPALALVLLSFLPLGWILMVDVVTAAIGIGITAFIRIPKPTAEMRADAQSHAQGYLGHTAEAVRYAWRIPGLRRALVMCAVMLTFVVPLGQMGPVFVVHLFGSEQWMLAACEMAFFIGMVAGGVTMGAWGGLRNRMTLATIGMAGFSAMVVLMGLAPNIWVFIAALGLMGFMLPVLNTPLVTAIQEIIPENMMGRVMSLVTLINTVCFPLGMAVAGPMADRVNVGGMAVVVGVAGLVFLAVLTLIGGPGSKLYAPQAAPSASAA
ncbi:MAG: MFS transporter [Propionibacteriaceae bacterium]|nr:MFS transporter [Propionibacteriaceae bacterium]